MNPNKLNDDENDGIHIVKIAGSVPCTRHGADIGDACWNVLSSRGILKAICNSRAVAAGANGPVTPYKSHAETRINKKKEYTR